MKKNIAFLAFIVLIAGCTNESGNGTQLANPSATFCIEQGFTYESRNTPLGEDGFCVFDDGSECNAWEYFREECTVETASPCKDLCGDGTCQEMVCEAIGCPCAETAETCPFDCLV